MKPLICPQCGGKVTEYAAWQKTATCYYCETKFIIETESQPKTAPDYFVEPDRTKITNPNHFVIALVVACVVVSALVVIGIVASKRPTKPTYPVYSTPYSTPRATPSPSPTPNPNLLGFGGKGTGNGLFQDADSIAVDKQGRIYVSDETLRVQQFDASGQYLKTWQIPAETSYYKRARSINKILVDEQERLHVLVAGLVLIYEKDSTEPKKLVHFAPNPIQDFVFRSDGGKLYLIDGETSEYFVHVNEAGKTVRRVDGFHTKAADAAVSPAATALAAIRFAVDGVGNIYSVYAFGDLGSYELNYNADELLIFRFTPEGKYVNKFVESMQSCGIAVDNQSRIYVTDNDSLGVYTSNGQPVTLLPNLDRIDAFTLDKENNIYIVQDDRVIKRPAIK